MKLNILIAISLLYGISTYSDYHPNSSKQSIVGVYRISNTYNALTVTNSKQLIYNNKIIGAFITYKNNLEVYKLKNNKFLYLNLKNNNDIYISKAYKWNLYPLYFPLQGVLL